MFRWSKIGEKQNLELGTVESLRSIKSKPGLFSRFWVWLKTIFSKPTNSKIETEIVETTSTQGNLATSELEALKSEEKEEPVESEIKFRIVQKGVDLEPEQMLVNAKVSLVEEESKEEPDPEDPEVNRRNLMRQGVHFFAKPAVENISNKIELPIVFWDERMSSVAAERALIEGNISRRRRAELIDFVAASYILQGALDRMQLFTLKNGKLYE